MSTNSKALETTIDALEGLTAEHAALVQHARTLAASLDAGAEDVKTHGEYRQVVKALLEAGKKKDVDAFERLLRELKGE